MPNQKDNKPGGSKQDQKDDKPGGARVDLRTMDPRKVDDFRERYKREQAEKEKLRALNNSQNSQKINR